MLTEDEEQLKKELEQYKAEKEKIRKILGGIGGKKSAKRDKIINYIFVFMVVVLFGFDLLRFAGVNLPFNVDFFIEMGVMLVSLKIIWMIHQQSRVFHFQFWILNSIEFRVTNLSNKIKKLDEKIEENEKS
ncbi:MAG: hypothetical protein K9M80_01335 [Candidatus Marinimicrobia bacterium]|nr:hypothetical protein [Candidatus Neomarinimicrobiota bacterium]